MEHELMLLVQVVIIITHLITLLRVTRLVEIIDHMDIRYIFLQQEIIILKHHMVMPEKMFVNLNIIIV